MATKNIPIRNSSYSPEETERIKHVLNYFDDFIDRQDYYEFFYSEKCGAFFAYTAKDSLRSERDGLVVSSDGLFRFLVKEICADIKSPRLAEQIGGNEGILPLEFAEAKRQVAAILEKMSESDRAHYSVIAEEELERIKNED